MSLDPLLFLRQGDRGGQERQTLRLDQCLHDLKTERVGGQEKRDGQKEEEEEREDEWILRGRDVSGCPR